VIGNPLPPDAAPQSHTHEGHEHRRTSNMSRDLAAASDSEPSIKEDSVMQRREYLWKVHSYINDYIRFADTKATFCFGISSALIAALFASNSHEHFVYGISRQQGLMRSLPVVISLCGCVLLGASILTAVAAIRPRLWVHSSKGFIFWESISRFSTPNEFAAAYNIQTEIELNEGLSHHLYSIAKVCRRKYFWANASVWTVLIGGTLAVLALILNR
jgi:hypothetical protein